MRRRISRALVAVSLISIFIAPTAIAADPTWKPDPNPSPVVDTLPSETTLAPKDEKKPKKSDVQANLTLEQDPYGCISRSDLPHLSDHFPGTVAARGNTICTSTVAGAYVRSKLFKQECFFAICWWTLVSDVDSVAPNTRSVSASPNYVCSGTTLRHFRIETYSEVLGFNGIVYSGNTANQTSTQIACG